MMEGENKTECSTPQELQLPLLKAEPSDAVVAVVDRRPTSIAERLEAALKVAPAANRSSDLVPLNHVYDVRRRELNAIVVAAEKYHQAISQLAEARMDMAIQCADLAAKSPIFGPIGQLYGGADSLVSVAREASNQAHTHTQSYKERVVDYCVEWESIVSSRIDDELKETKQLRKRLDHYQNKVAGLRTKVNHYNGTGTESPSKLTKKLARNEVKLEKAWKAHEESSTRVCNLIDEVTLHGWMDLYPLVVASMQWEVERASAECEVISKLKSVTDDLVKEFEKNSITVESTTRVPIADVKEFEKNSVSVESTSGVPIALEKSNVSEPETYASLDQVEDDSSSQGSEASQGSERVAVAEDNVDEASLTLKRTDSLSEINETPLSPKEVAQKDGGSDTPLSPNEVAQKGGGWWPLH